MEAGDSPGCNDHEIEFKILRGVRKESSRAQILVYKQADSTLSMKLYLGSHGKQLYGVNEVGKLSGL